eukprot:UN30116
MLCEHICVHENDLEVCTMEQATSGLEAESFELGEGCFGRGYIIEETDAVYETRYVAGDCQHVQTLYTAHFKREAQQTYTTKTTDITIEYKQTYEGITNCDEAKEVISYATAGTLGISANRVKVEVITCASTSTSSRRMNASVPESEFDISIIVSSDEQ